MAYTTAWNPANPTGSEAANTIDNIFRGLKVDLQERLIGLLGLANFTADPLVFYTAPTAWTPVIGGSGGTTGQAYTTQVGRYIKIGKLVVANFNCVLSNKGTITTDVQIQGLPVASCITASSHQVGNVSIWSTLVTAVICIPALIAPNTTAATLYKVTAASASNTTTALATADINNTTQLVGQFVYEAAT